MYFDSLHASETTTRLTCATCTRIIDVNQFLRLIGAVTHIQMTKQIIGELVPLFSRTCANGANNFIIAPGMLFCHMLWQRGPTEPHLAAYRADETLLHIWVDDLPCKEQRHVRSLDDALEGMIFDVTGNGLV